MAAPTEDQLLDYLNRTADRLAPGDKHVLFEWRALLDNARRAHDSTSQAIEKRLGRLIDRGDLVQVRVSHNGYVTLGGELGGDILYNLYFQYERHVSYAAPEWGFVTDVRPTNQQNPWANGDRYLYTTKACWEEMLRYFGERRTAQAERRKEKREASKAKLREIIGARDPDAEQVLKQLAEAVPGVRPELLLLASERPSLDLTAHGEESVSALLGVLRRGLESAP